MMPSTQLDTLRNCLNCSIELNKRGRNIGSKSNKYGRKRDRGKYFCSRECYLGYIKHSYDYKTYVHALKIWHQEMSMVPIKYLPREIVDCIIKLWEVKKEIGMARVSYYNQR